jgi:hypothetical protein
MPLCVDNFIEGATIEFNLYKNSRLFGPACFLIISNNKNQHNYSLAC